MYIIKKLLIGAMIGAFFLINPATVSAQVKLNEIFANPANEDDEFIELFNPSDQAIDITGYKLTDLTNKPFIIPEATISAKGFYSFRTISKFQLNNTGQETVALKNAADSQIDSFSFEGTTEGKSFSRIPDGENWVSNTEVTEANANTAPAASVSPEASPSPEAQASQSPSPAPSPAASKAPSPSPKASPSPSPEEEIIDENVDASPEEIPEVLGATDTAKPTNPYLPAIILIGLGLALIGASAWGIMKHGKMAKS